jgi:predicted permease
MRELLRKLAYLGRRSGFERELDQEIEFHIEARADELEQGGLSHREAMAQARREFGPAARAREDTRSAWQFRWLEDLCADLRYAVRSFRRSPAFALTAIACLALGIAANTTIFSIATELLFSQPSCRDPQSLVYVRIGGHSHASLRELRFIRDARIFEGLAGQRDDAEFNWRYGDATYRLSGETVTDNFFEVTGVPVAMGRPMQAGERAVAVLSWGFWQARLAGDPHVIGRTLILDGRPHTVIGILPADHRTFSGFGYAPDLYVPVAGDNAIVAFYGRVPRDTSRAALYAKLQSACQELDRAYPDGDHKWARSIEIQGINGLDRIRAESFFMTVAAFFAMLLVVVGLVLLIACANVASLLVARASSHAQELAIRLSIGAGRGRIIRQLLAESFLLVLCGAGAGLLLNLWLTHAISRFTPPVNVPIRLVIQPDWRLLAYASAVTVASTLAAGLLPALKGTRAGLAGRLKLGEHQVDRGRWSLRNTLVVAQLAVSVVLLSAAFLFLRNLVASSSMSPGFDVNHTVWSYMRLAPGAYLNEEKIRALVDTALERLRSTPGVESATIAHMVPFNDDNSYLSRIRTDIDSRPQPLHYTVTRVAPDYFKTMGIPVLTGREFLDSERKGSPEVAILNENLAWRLFGNVNPVGHTFRYEKGAPVAIVGVTRNSKYFSLGEQNRLGLYTPYFQARFSQIKLNFLVRARTPASVLKPVDAALLKLDSSASIETKPMRNALGLALLPSQAGALLLGATGLLGLVLAAIGLYGALLYMVTRRIREIGLRVALGATPARVLRMIVRQSLSLVAVGVALGIGMSAFAVQPLARFLVPQVRLTDTANFVVVAAALFAVGMAATLSPALRALRVDPATALRHD